MKKQIINIILLSFFLLGTLGRIAAKDIVFKAGKDFKTLFITKDNVTVNVVKGKGDWGNKTVPTTHFGRIVNSKLLLPKTKFLKSYSNGKIDKPGQDASRPL